jgi:hypothetical protein
MSSDEARRIVQFGLDRRKEDRDTAAKEARLEKYEQEQILFCNAHSAAAKAQRQLEETGRRNMQQYEARRTARAQALAMEMAREQAAADAVKKYGVFCLATLCLTIFTHLPLWAAITTALGMGVFPAAYIFRLYYPLED